MSICITNIGPYHSPMPNTEIVVQSPYTIHTAMAFWKSANWRIPSVTVHVITSIHDFHVDWTMPGSVHPNWISPYRPRYANSLWIVMVSSYNTVAVVVLVWCHYSVGRIVVPNTNWRPHSQHRLLNGSMLPPSMMWWYHHHWKTVRCMIGYGRPNDIRPHRSHLPIIVVHHG